MKKAKLLRQTLDISVKIFSAFVIVFILYYLSNIIEDFSYNYFIFPLVSIIIIFVCGIKVGQALEKMKRNEAIGFFTKHMNTSKRRYEQTEFTIHDTKRFGVNKKILKQYEDGDKIHIKVFNYNDVVNEKEGE